MEPLLRSKRIHPKISETKGSSHSVPVRNRHKALVVGAMRERRTRETFRQAFERLPSVRWSSRFATPVEYETVP